MVQISFNVDLGHTPKKWYLRANLRECRKNPAYRDVGSVQICETNNQGIVNPQSWGQEEANMKHSRPPAGSVSPCIRIFIESLISEVEDASVTWVFEPEKADTIRPPYVEIDKAKPTIRLRAS
jgi:hypothetical protein